MKNTGAAVVNMHDGDILYRTLVLFDYYYLQQLQEIGGRTLLTQCLLSRLSLLSLLLLLYYRCVCLHTALLQHSTHC